MLEGETLSIVQKAEELTQYIIKQEKVLTRDLVQKFNVSTPTIHRVFDKLSLDGGFKRVHGGIIANTEKEESLFHRKLKHQQRHKKAICVYVARELLSVTEEDVVAIDSGTTAYHLVDYITLANINIISNCLRIVSQAA